MIDISVMKNAYNSSTITYFISGEYQRSDEIKGYKVYEFNGSKEVEIASQPPYPVRIAVDHNEWPFVSNKWGEVYMYDGYTWIKQRVLAKDLGFSESRRFLIDMYGEISMFSPIEELYFMNAK